MTKKFWSTLKHLVKIPQRLTSHFARLLLLASFYSVIIKRHILPRNGTFDYHSKLSNLIAKYDKQRF